MAVRSKSVPDSKQYTFQTEWILSWSQYSAAANRLQGSRYRTECIPSDVRRSRTAPRWKASIFPQEWRQSGGQPLKAALHWKVSSFRTAWKWSGHRPLKAVPHWQMFSYRIRWMLSVAHSGIHHSVQPWKKRRSGNRQPHKLINKGSICWKLSEGNVIKLRKSSKEIRSMIKGIGHTPGRMYQKKERRKDRSGICLKKYWHKVRIMIICNWKV